MTPARRKSFETIPINRYLLIISLIVLIEVTQLLTGDPHTQFSNFQKSRRASPVD